MTTWKAVCDGGPNDRAVGCEAPSLGKIFGRAEAMARALNATRVLIFRADLQDFREVATEADASPGEDITIPEEEGDEEGAET